MKDFNKWIYGKAYGKIMVEQYLKRFDSFTRQSLKTLIKAMWKINDTYENDSDGIQMYSSGVAVPVETGGEITFGNKKYGGRLQALEAALTYIMNNEEEI